jgi:Arc/MetJ-type ribon-helix-helix transcriptional regulator
MNLEPVMRVNARLDEQTEVQMQYLTQATGQSVSHVVREAIALYHVQVRQRQAKPSRLLAMVGKGDSGRSDIGSNVKHYVAEAIDAKFRRSHGK